MGACVSGSGLKGEEEGARGRAPTRASAPADAALEALELDDPIAFERRVRALYGDQPPARIRGDCVLDAGEHNILLYEQGRWSLVERDVLAAFGLALGARVAEFLNARGSISDAFAIRRNCVNLKKVLLHAQYDIAIVEKKLRRLSTFYRSDFAVERRYAFGFRYRSISVAGARAKGTFLAIADARVFTKQICCVPRLPSQPRPKRLASMPRTLTTHGCVKRARARLREQTPTTVDFAGAHSYAFDPEDYGAPNLTDDFETLMREVQAELQLPTHACAFIRASLIARGAAKAMCIRRECEAYAAAVEDVTAIADATIIALDKEHKDPDAVLRDEMKYDGVHAIEHEPTQANLDALQAAVKVDVARNELAGAAPVAREMAFWMRKILANPSSVLFTAGDCAQATSFVPDAFALTDIIASYAPIIDTYHDAMIADVAAFARSAGADCSSAQASPPPWHVHVAGPHACSQCHASFSNLWINQHARVCVVCELAARAARRCPFAKPNAPAPCLGAFCPHALKCVACERHSCAQCGITCGDAEDFIALIEAIDARAVFLDFDRTICATKRGASPLPSAFATMDATEIETRAKARSADEDLLATLATHENAWVVTRNPNTRAIEVFLRARGVAVPRVVRVTKGESKGRAMRDVLARTSSGFGSSGAVACAFADDDIRELLRDDVREIPGLRRMLFTRQHKL